MEKIKLGIYGLGLIGSSILKGLSANSDYEIYCVSNSSSDKALKYTSNASSDINILKDCDILFVCSGADKTLSVLEKLDGVVAQNAIVCDVCSIKKIFKKFNFDFIMTHPMAGTEHFGFDAGFAELFKSAKWLIEKENDILIKVISDLGAIPKVIDMVRHNELCAQISHLPNVLAYLLFDAASDEAKEIAAGGFRDMTRLAQSNPEMILAMFNDNLAEIEKVFQKVKDNFEHLKNLSDSEKITLFDKISVQRKEMYDSNGKNIFKI